MFDCRALSLFLLPEWYPAKKQPHMPSDKSMSLLYQVETDLSLCGESAGLAGAQAGIAWLTTGASGKGGMGSRTSAICLAHSSAIIAPQYGDVKRQPAG
jgi:hypothetical protein